MRKYLRNNDNTFRIDAMRLMAYLDSHPEEAISVGVKTQSVARKTISYMTRHKERVRFIIASRQTQNPTDGSQSPLDANDAEPLCSESGIDGIPQDASV